MYDFAVPGILSINGASCNACAVTSQDPLVIKKILAKLRGKSLSLDMVGLPESRAPPQDDLFS